MPIRPIKTDREDILEDEFEDIIEDEEELMEDEEYEEDDDEEEEYEYEDDDEDEYDEYEERSKLVPYTIMAVALVAFISLSVYAYNAGTEATVDEELILIQADQTPVKEKPLDPGGMQFPYQDKSVFETITADRSGAGVPAVVSNTEEPIAIEPEVTTAIIQEAKPAEPVAEVVASTEQALAKPAEVVAVETPTPVKPVEKVASAPEPLVKEAKPVAKVAAKPATPAPTAAKGNGAIQLGAYRSQADAQAAWNGIKSKHSVLNAHSPSIIRADLGEKGVFYRLRVVDVDAASMCAALKTAGQPCMKAK